ncbi:MAG: Gfo/Idh/MocA family protein [Acidobacteriota bacterium]
MTDLDRRGLLKAALFAGAALEPARAAAAAKPLRIGFVGMGARGAALLDLALRFESVEVPAVCDIDAARLERARKLVESRAGRAPEGYGRGETDFRRLCERADLDVVLNATPWQWHAPVSIAAMKAGKHAATETPAAVTLEECHELVEVSEKTGRHCALLENDCYLRQTLLVLNMFRGGLLGEPLFAETGYCQDLRAASTPWMLEHAKRRNGNLYPTHAIGPVAWWMDINRGDRFTHLVSMSTKQGLVNTTLIRTAQGRTITLYYDTGTPRPTEKLTRVQGSKGVYSGMLNKVFVDGRSNRSEGPNWLHNPEWEDIAPYEAEYGHKLWAEHGEAASKTAHGGSDYMVLYRLIKNLSANRAPDIDVYDAAAWSAIAPLSEASVAGRNRMVEFPDFTGGRWKSRAPIDPGALV